MNRVFLLFLPLVLSVSQLQAAAVGDFARLAPYFPAETPLYIALYISNEAINRWDTALDPIIDPDTSYGLVRVLLDSQTSQVDPDGTFESVYRPWLGDILAYGALTPETLAIGTRDSTGESGELFAVEVTNHDAAEEHLDRVIEAGIGLFWGFRNYEKFETEDYILYYPQESTQYSSTFLLLEDVLLIRFSSITPESIIPDYEETLAELDSFEAALQRLPLDHYEIAMYFNPSALAPYAEEYDAQIRVNTILPEHVNTAEALLALGPQTLGLAFVNDYSLVLDVATHVDDPEALADAGIEIIVSSPVNLELSRNLPNTVRSFIQDTGLGLGFLQTMTYLKERGESYDIGGWRSQSLMSYFAEWASTMLYSFYGLKQQMPTAMDSDRIVYVTNDNVVVANPSYYGVLFQIPDPIQRAAAMDILSATLAEQGINVVDNGSTLLIDEFAETADDSSLRITISSFDNYLSLASAFAVLDPVAMRLGESEAYLRAEALFVHDAQIIGYTLMEDRDYPWLESASFSISYDEEGTGYLRLMLQILVE